MNERKYSGIWIKNAALHPYLCPGQDLARLSHCRAPMGTPVTNEPAQGSSRPHTNLYYGMRLDLCARENICTPVNMLATLWASPRDC